MSLRNRMIFVAALGCLAVGQSATAGEMRIIQSKAAQPPRPAAPHARIQRINVIDPDRTAQRVNHGGQGRYRRWQIGEVLPPAIWARRFWLGDPTRYDLDRPNDGNAWVRYGPDALLVDLHNGQIIEAVYGFDRSPGSYQH
jgi:Ni/Co efflux regulator RcnB